jgi:23S rRNA (cytosine1962-C5)-methyltransferase
MSQIVIKPGREKSLLRRHPWIFSGAIAAVHGLPGLGETVEVVSSAGDFLARAAYNPNSNITGRIWTWDPLEEVTPELFERRIKQSINLRRQLSGLINSNAMRLVHAESDAIPGLILDQYNDVYIVQFLTAGVEFWKENILEIIKRITQAKIVYERSDVDVRKLEGLPLRKGLLHGQEPNDSIQIEENGLKLLVDIVGGHKTGYYLDQRDNRLMTRKIADGKKVLDCFSYTGGFAMNALLGQASTACLVDSSGIALEGARKNIELNNLRLENVTFVDEDVFKYLRTLRDRAEYYDLIILDPPKFAPTVSQAERAARAYKDVNLLALKLLNPGGYLMTFSCSGGVSEELFQRIVAGAALEADVGAKIIKRLHQAADHPVALNFPEGAYLKGFLIQKEG